MYILCYGLYVLWPVLCSLFYPMIQYHAKWLTKKNFCEKNDKFSSVMWDVKRSYALQINWLW